MYLIRFIYSCFSWTESQTGILSSGRKTSRKGAQAKPGGIVRVFNHSEETSPNQTTTALTSSTSSNERSLTSSSGNSGWDVQLVSNSHSNNEATNVPTTPLSQRSNTLMSPPQRSAPATSVVSNLNVPYCSLNQMRLSFHAHRHDVKFFVGAKRKLSLAYIHSYFIKRPFTVFQL